MWRAMLWSFRDLAWHGGVLDRSSPHPSHEGTDSFFGCSCAHPKHWSMDAARPEVLDLEGREIFRGVLAFRDRF